MAPLITNSVSYLFAQQQSQTTTPSCDIIDHNTHTNTRQKQSKGPTKQQKKKKIVHSVQTYAPAFATHTCTHTEKGVTLKIEEEKKLPYRHFQSALRLIPAF